MNLELRNIYNLFDALGAHPQHKRGRGYVRMLVRIRDGFTCRDCGSTRFPKDIIGGNKGGNKLFDIHHIKGLCGKNSRGYDSSDDLSGLVTLCHSCHFSRHDFSKRLGTNKLDGFNKAPVLTPQISEMIELRKQDKSLREIGQVYEMSGENVRRLIRPFVEPWQPKPKMPITKTCKHCPRSFETTTDRVTCGTDECRQERKAAADERTKLYHRKFARWYYHNVLKKRPDFKELTKKRNDTYARRKGVNSGPSQNLQV